MHRYYHHGILIDRKLIMARFNSTTVMGKCVNGSRVGGSRVQNVNEFFKGFSFFGKIKVWHSIFQFLENTKFHKNRNTQCYPCNPREFLWIKMNSQAPNLMPRKYAANQPIFSQAGVMWPRSRHLLRMENRCVGEASCLERLTLNPLVAHLYPLQMQISPPQCPGIFHRAIPTKHFPSLEPWHLHAPSIPSKSLCHLQALRALPRSAQQPLDTEYSFVWVNQVVFIMFHWFLPILLAVLWSTPQNKGWYDWESFIQLWKVIFKAWRDWTSGGRRWTKEGAHMTIRRSHHWEV